MPMSREQVDPVTALQRARSLGDQLRARAAQLAAIADECVTGASLIHLLHTETGLHNDPSVPHRPSDVECLARHTVGSRPASSILTKEPHGAKEP